MATRYGGMKQVDGFGPNNETIIDYSIHDAIRAGFGKVVFIIKEEFLESFKGLFEPKLQGKVEVDYVFQKFDLSAYGITKEIERQKPWGTGHALLEASEKVKEPFCIINADDFYSYDSFEKMANFLNTEVRDDYYALMGYEVDKTLSENGSVSRGICKVSADGNLEEIVERTKVTRNGDKLVNEEDDGSVTVLDDDLRASMNFWGFTPAIFEQAKPMFQRFVEANEGKPKAEFFIPLIAEELTKTGQAKFKVIPTSSQWFGVTYKEDKPIVQKNLNDLVENGTYPSKLW